MAMTFAGTLAVASFLPSRRDRLRLISRQSNLICFSVAELLSSSVSQFDNYLLSVGGTGPWLVDGDSFSEVFFSSASSSLSRACLALSLPDSDMDLFDVAQMKPNRPLFLQSKQVLAVQDQKVYNKMLIST